MATKQEKPVCLRCSGPMEEGFVSDTIGHTTLAGFWIEGSPARLIKERQSEPTEFLNKVFQPERKNLIKRTLIIQVFRCELCGYLESYANKNTPRNYREFD